MMVRMMSGKMMSGRVGLPTQYMVDIETSHSSGEENTSCYEMYW